MPRPRADRAPQADGPPFLCHNAKANELALQYLSDRGHAQADAELDWLSVIVDEHGPRLCVPQFNLHGEQTQVQTRFLVGDGARFLSEAGSTVQPSFLRRLDGSSWASARTRERIALCEGWSKGAALRRLGLHAICLPGIQGWSIKQSGVERAFKALREPQGDLVRAIYGHEIFVFFDSDWATNPDVEIQQELLALQLWVAGAHDVQVVRLPSATGEDGAVLKQGIDDLVVRWRAEDLDVEAEFEELLEQAKPPRPVIQADPGAYHRAMALLDRTLSLVTADLFDRGGELALVVPQDPRNEALGHKVAPVTRDQLTLLADKYARWCKRVVRYNDEGEKVLDTLETIAPHHTVIGAYLAEGAERSLPGLLGLTHVPTLREDWTILQAPGYDAQSGLFLSLKREYPEVPEQPTKRDAERALLALCDPVSLFPYSDLNFTPLDEWVDGGEIAPVERRLKALKKSVDFAVVIAALLTAVARRALPLAPFFGIDANQPGSGKTKLAELILALLDVATSLFTWAKSEEENGKRLDAVLLSAVSAAVIDNVDKHHRLGGPTFNAMLTTEQLTPRVLSESRMPACSTRVLWVATGNRLQISEDVRRRALVCRLTVLTDKPERLAYPFDPVEIVKKRRAELVVAALTILRAYVVAGMPGKPERLGSYEAWSDLVRGATMWVGCQDPVASQDRAAAEDPTDDRTRELFSAWRALIGLDRGVETGELVAEMYVGKERRAERDALDQALWRFKGARDGALTKGDAGYVLRGLRDAVSGGLMLTYESKSRKWTLTRVGGPEESE